MPAYVYRCPEGHVTELVQSIHDPLPERIECEAVTDLEGAAYAEVLPDGEHVPRCGDAAERVFTVPAAFHFKGPGFYTTDYKLKYDRKRRKNPGDDLPIPSEAAITRAEGAEYDPPKVMPDVVQRQAA